MKLSRRLSIAIALVSVAVGAFAVSATCPIDNLSMMWTGKTRVEMGKMLYEVKCLNGHTSWVVQ